MHFEYPWVLLLLPIFLFCEKRCPLRLDMLFFPRISLVAKIARRTSLLQAFKWIAITGTLVALASPVSETLHSPTRVWTRDLVLVVDASRSMDEPFSMTQGANKFETLKKILKNFIKKRKNERLGLVVFGEFAYVASPLTFDHKILASMVPLLEVGMAGERTAVYDALAMAVKLLENSEAKSRVVVLLTDGRNTAGKIPFGVGVKLARKYGVKVYTIGVGPEEGYDREALESLARQTGGKFFAAADPAMLAKVYRTIDALEPTRVEREPVKETRYLYEYPLYVAAMSLLIYLFLLNRSEVG